MFTTFAQISLSPLTGFVGLCLLIKPVLNVQTKGGADVVINRAGQYHCALPFQVCL